jgi:plastocyanin
MRTILRAVVAIVLSMLWTATLAQAGEVKGRVTATGLKSAENIVIYIDTIPGKKFNRPTPHVAVDQRNMLFVSRTTVIQQGTTVDFLNHDNVAHNVYWPSINGDKRFRHSMTIVSPNQQKSFQFDNVGAAELLCNIHPEMVGYVVVVPTPYFALTGNDGTFSIKDVPPGSYTLKTWSEDGKPTAQKITTGDGATNADITVTK